MLFVGKIVCCGGSTLKVTSTPVCLAPLVFSLCSVCWSQSHNGFFVSERRGHILLINPKSGVVRQWTRPAGTETTASQCFLLKILACFPVVFAVHSITESDAHTLIVGFRHQRKTDNADLPFGCKPRDATSARLCVLDLKTNVCVNSCALPFCVVFQKWRDFGDVLNCIESSEREEPHTARVHRYHVSSFPNT